MPRALPSRGDVLAAFQGASRPLHARELAARLSVGEADLGRLSDTLQALVLDGLLAQLPGHRYRALATAAEEQWEGVLSMHARGFGFVNAAGRDDVYVAPEAVGAALHGDTVRVAVLGRGRRGVEGRVVEVVRRRSPNVAGLLRRRGKSVWLEPDDARLRGPLVIVGAGREGRDGDGAVARIVRFPTRPDENPEAELMAVLGPPGEARSEVQKILLRESVADDHSADALAEAALQQRRLATLREGRVDLTGVPLPTIDPEDARDHDDAVWVERHGRGYRVWVAIADVAEAVQPGGALDVEAFARGCSVYLPDRAIPMLPPALAADTCSLLPDVERLCLCLRAELDAKGAVRSFDLVEGRMRSRARLTYGGVARALGFTERPPVSPAAQALREGLSVMAELTEKLRRARLANGALDLNLPEARVELDPVSGRPVSVTSRTEDPGVQRAYQMIEELMLLANFTVARFLTERRVPTVFRVHGKPDEAKLERLAEVAALLGAPVEAAELGEPLGAARFLRSIARHPRRRVLEMLLLRSLQQASYDVTNVGHFGLAADAYVHFTSPIRRYPDLLIHRAVKALLRGERTDRSPEARERLRAAATQSSQRERAALEVEREVVDLYRALLMRDHLGEVFEGTVVGLGSSGVYVSLADPFVDVLVRFESLGPDRYDVTEDELALVGARSGDVVALGDAVTVEIEDVALLRRQVYGRRIPPEAVLRALEDGRRVPPPAAGALGRASGRRAREPRRAGVGATAVGVASRARAAEGRGERSAGAAKGRGGGKGSPAGPRGAGPGKTAGAPGGARRGGKSGRAPRGPRRR